MKINKNILVGSIIGISIYVLGGSILLYFLKEDFNGLVYFVGAVVGTFMTIFTSSVRKENKEVI